MSRDIPGYEGPELAASNLRVYRSVLSSSHIKQVEDWIRQNLKSSCYAGGWTITFEGGWDKMKRFIGLTASFSIKDMLNECGNQTFNATYPRNATCPYTPSSSSTQTSISKWCTSYGVLRAIIMHEVVEAYVAMKFYKATSPIRGSKEMNAAHDIARDVVKLHTIEKTEERAMRHSNFEDCKWELAGICEELKRRNLGISPLYDRLYRDASILVERMKQMSNQTKYIPGYCETYQKKGYAEERYSSIANLFQEAKRRLIYPVHVSGKRP